jgi:hypothetical protein
MRVGRRVGDAVTSDIPSFQELLQDLQHGSFHMSSSWLLLPSSSSTVYPSAALNPGGRAALVSTLMTRVSILSSNSGFTETSATNGGGHIGSGTNVTAAHRSYIANPACDAEFDELQLCRRTREHLRAHPPPANNANKELCVSWLGLWCYANCGRAVTHHPFANTTELTLLTAAPASAGVTSST